MLHARNWQCQHRLRWYDSGITNAHTLLVDFYTTQAKLEWMAKDGEQWPSEFMHESALNLLHTRPQIKDATMMYDASVYMEAKKEKDS
jgi:hypothetical protein